MGPVGTQSGDVTVRPSGTLSNQMGAPRAEPGNVRAPGGARQCHSAPSRIRTCDTRFRKPMLYPLSYRGADRRPAATRWWARQPSRPYGRARGDPDDPTTEPRSRACPRVSASGSASEMRIRQRWVARPPGRRSRAGSSLGSREPIPDHVHPTCSDQGPDALIHWPSIGLERARRSRRAYRSRPAYRPARLPASGDVDLRLLHHTSQVGLVVLGSTRSGMAGRARLRPGRRTAAVHLRGYNRTGVVLLIGSHL